MVQLNTSEFRRFLDGLLDATKGNTAKTERSEIMDNVEKLLSQLVTKQNGKVMCTLLLLKLEYTFSIHQQVCCCNFVTVNMRPNKGTSRGGWSGNICSPNENLFVNLLASINSTYVGLCLLN